MSGFDDRFIAAIALAVSQRPRATLQEIASMAGFSKATLYRFAPTREAVISILLEQAAQHMKDALVEADLENQTFNLALETLTKSVLKQKELYLFWNAALWMDLVGSKKDDVLGYGPSFYSDELEKFFLKGQKAGAFRVDMPAKWLAKTYDFLVYAAVESAQRGEMAIIGLPAMVDQMFLHGAAADSTGK